MKKTTAIKKDKSNYPKYLYFWYPVKPSILSYKGNHISIVGNFYTNESDAIRNAPDPTYGKCELLQINNWYSEQEWGFSELKR